MELNAHGMDLTQAIYERRSVRAYTPVPVPPDMVIAAIRAATRAPSAGNQQPWDFAVVRGRDCLDKFSERAKSHMLATLPQMLSLHRRADALASEDYHAFHHAGTLVIVLARPTPHRPIEDCCLAAQNLMLAAHGMGLGTCPVGFLRPWLDLSATKEELGIPLQLTVVMPIVLGWPAGAPSAVSRDEPNIVAWIDSADQSFGTVSR